VDESFRYIYRTQLLRIGCILVEVDGFYASLYRIVGKVFGYVVVVVHTLGFVACLDVVVVLD